MRESVLCGQIDDAWKTIPVKHLASAQMCFIVRRLSIPEVYGVAGVGVQRWEKLSY
jgi:hypothetical protein